MARFVDDETPPAATQTEPKPEATTPQPAQPQPVQQTTQPRRPVIEEKRVCGACKKPVDHLKYKRCVVEYGKASTDGLSHMVDFECENEGKHEILAFICPNCNMVLFVEEDDAVDFLEE